MVTFDSRTKIPIHFSLFPRPCVGVVLSLCRPDAHCYGRDPDFTSGLSRADSRESTGGRYPLPRKAPYGRHVAGHFELKEFGLSSPPEGGAIIHCVMNLDIIT